MGKLEYPRMRYYLVLSDKMCLSDGCTVFLTRRGGRGAQRVRLYRRIPGTVSHPDTTTDTGAEATAPLLARRRTWHASPRPSPLAPTSSTLTGRRLLQGAIFKSLLLHMRFILLQEGCSRPAVSCYTHICPRRT